MRNLQALLSAMNFEAILKAKDGVTTTFQNKFVVSKNTLYISKDPGLVVS